MGYYKNQTAARGSSKKNNWDVQQPSIKNIGDALEKIPGLVSVKELSEITDKAAMMFGNAAKANLRALIKDHTHTDLIDSIGIIRKRGGRAVPFSLVGPRYYTSKRSGRHGGQAAHLFEWGTVARYRFVGNKHLNLSSKRVKEATLGKASTGIMPAQPFMRPAFESQKGPVAAFLKQEVKKVVAAKVKAAGFQFKAA